MMKAFRIFKKKNILRRGTSRKVAEEKREKEGGRKGMKGSTDRSHGSHWHGRANESNPVTNRRSDANLEVCEFLGQATRHENLVLKATR